MLNQNPKQPPPNDKWCVGCSPDNCSCCWTPLDKVSKGMIWDQREILRRIAERGMKMAHEHDKQFVDIFQHLLDEIERL